MKKISENWLFGEVVTVFEEQSSPKLDELCDVLLEAPTSFTYCGLGWEIGFSNGRVPSPEPPVSSAPPLDWYEVDVYFKFSLGGRHSTPPLDVHVAFTGGYSHDMAKQGPRIIQLQFPCAEVDRETPIATSYAIAVNSSSRLQIKISVKFPTDTQTTKPPLEKIYDALGTAMDGIEIIDTQFCLLSRRSHEGTKCQVRSVFACSKLLMGFSTELDDLISGAGFSESSNVDLASEISWEFDQEDSLSDSDLEPLNASETRLTSSKVYPTNDFKSSVATEAETTGTTKVDEPVLMKVRYGRRIIVKDVAYRTWKALIIYLYTGAVNFAPPGPNSKACVGTEPHFCSPKSMYRLADRFGLQELKVLSFNEIKSRINVRNISSELFSKFSSCYPEIQKMNVQFTCDNYSTKLVCEGVKQKTLQLLNGAHPHAKHVFMALMDELTPKSPKKLKK